MISCTKAVLLLLLIYTATCFSVKLLVLNSEFTKGRLVTFFAHDSSLSFVSSRQKIGMEGGWLWGCLTFTPSSESRVEYSSLVDRHFPGCGLGKSTCRWCNISTARYPLPLRRQWRHSSSRRALSKCRNRARHCIMAAPLEHPTTKICTYGAILNLKLSIGRE